MYIHSTRVLRRSYGRRHCSMQHHALHNHEPITAAACAPRAHLSFSYGTALLPLTGPIWSGVPLTVKVIKVIFAEFCPFYTWQILEKYGKSWNLKFKFSRPWKVWKMTIGMEKYGKLLCWVYIASVSAVQQSKWKCSRWNSAPVFWLCNCHAWQRTRPFCEFWPNHVQIAWCMRPWLAKACTGSYGTWSDCCLFFHTVKRV